MSDLTKLITALDEMPHGSAQAEAARRLWSLAQKEKDPSLRFNALSSITTAANFSGADDFFLSLLPQLVEIRKRHPEAVDMHQYVWRLKWFVTSMIDFPEVSLKSIESGLEYYREALRDHGGNERTVLYLKWVIACLTGRFEEAAPLREQFKDMKRDANSDCLACEVNWHVTESVFLNQHARALEVASPIINDGMKCNSVPGSTFANLLLPLLFLGETEKAAKFHRRGYAVSRANVSLLDIISDHLIYLTAIGDTAKCLRLLKTHTPWLEHNFNPADHLGYFSGAAISLRIMNDTQARKRPLQLPLPAKLIQTWGAKAMPVGDLADHFENEARHLARAFDRRNGNTWREDNLDRQLLQARQCRERLCSKQEPNDPAEV